LDTGKTNTFDDGEIRNMGEFNGNGRSRNGRTALLERNGSSAKARNGRSQAVSSAHDEEAALMVDYAGQIAAISKSQAVIEFDLNGTIKTANENFLRAVGYSLEEIVGQHHSLFVDPEHHQSAEYKDFWRDLVRGNYRAGEFKRLGKGGREIWIQASYNPILDMEGKPFKVVKYAMDITAMKLQFADFSGQLGAISKSQAVIEFELDAEETR
jgi:methyl-accepting chemotaxis protein